MKERSSHWWEQVVNSSFTRTDWLEKFRVSEETFLYLCNELRNSYHKNRHGNAKGHIHRTKRGSHVVVSFHGI